MKTREQITQIIERCVRRNVPFAVMMDPESDVPVFISREPDEEGECEIDLRTDYGFFINFFGNDEPYLAGVKGMNNFTDTLALLDMMEQNNGFFMPADVVPVLKSTSKLAYEAKMRKLLAKLKRFGGKVVMSQVTVAASKKRLGDVMWTYFDMFPSTFRHLSFTPETGIWLGATPEVLALCREGEILTMALAGTKSKNDAREWDEKNLKEHAAVVDYICQILSFQELEVEVDDARKIEFGEIEHLCHLIKGRGNFNPESLLYALSPTPAVSGFPDSKAIAEILPQIEGHSRHCYGGFVGYRTPDATAAYVNLRSALVAPCRLDGEDAYIYNIYSGGGVLAESNIDDEWDEAMKKCRPLLEAVLGKDCERPVSYEARVTFGDTVSRSEFLMSHKYGK